MQPETTGTAASRSSSATLLVAGEPLHSGDRLHLHPNDDFAPSKPVRSDRLAVDHSDAGELAPLSGLGLKTTAVGPVGQPHILTGGPHPSGLNMHARAPVRCSSVGGVFSKYAFDVVALRGLDSLWACCTVALLAQLHSAASPFAFSINLQNFLRIKY